MAENKEKRLTPRQADLLVELLNPANRTLEAARLRCGVPRRTAERWMATGVFRQALDEATGTVIGAAANRLVGTLPFVIDTLMGLCAKENPHHVRVRAATALADLTLRLVDTQMLERRLAALEVEINARK